MHSSQQQLAVLESSKFQLLTYRNVFKRIKFLCPFNIHNGHGLTNNTPVHLQVKLAKLLKTIVKDIFYLYNQHLRTSSRHQRHRKSPRPVFSHHPPALSTTFLQLSQCRIPTLFAVGSFYLHLNPGVHILWNSKTITYHDTVCSLMSHSCVTICLFSITICWWPTSSLALQWLQMGAIVSQITSLTIVFSTVISDADQRKHQSSASLAFVRGIHRGPVNSPHKWPITRKIFPFDDVIMAPIYQWELYPDSLQSKAFTRPVDRILSVNGDLPFKTN